MVAARGPAGEGREAAGRLAPQGRGRAREARPVRGNFLPVAADNVRMDSSLARRRALRRDATDAEVVLWRLLRSRQLLGLKFRRQHSLGPYVVDFFCADHRLAVELDGGQHFTLEGQAHDRRRTEYLASHGVRILRFSNRELFGELEGVLEAIRRACVR
jgi:very-short-patch-repair endonuclease